MREDTKAMLIKYNCLHMADGKAWAADLVIKTNNRLRRTLGRACYGRKTIELSGRVQMESFDHVRETLVHELCHFIAWFEHKERGHGETFKRLMRTHWNVAHKGRFHSQPLTTEYRYVAEYGKRILVKKVDKTAAIIQKSQELRKVVPTNYKTQLTLF